MRPDDPAGFVPVPPADSRLHMLVVVALVFCGAALMLAAAIFGG